MNGEMNRFNPANHRVREAKLRNGLDKSEILLLLLLVLMVAGWVWLCGFLKNSLGWLMLGVASGILMVLTWTRNRLRHIPLGKTEDINDLLSGDAMNVLTRTLTAGKSEREVARELIMRTKSGRFLAMRYNLGEGVMQELFQEMSGAELEQMMEAAFMKAREVRSRAGSRQIGGGDLVVGMILAKPEAEDVLRRYGLEGEELVNGVAWFNYLYNLAKQERKPKRVGGIARDLNFGYIPTLQHYGRNISERLSYASRSQIKYTNRNEALEKMIEIFSGNARQNVALIGPEGSGRSLIVKAFAEELLDEASAVPRNLKYRQIFQLDATALLAATGGAPGNLERLLTKIFNEAYAAKNIIIYLNDAQLFFGQGSGAVDIANFLMPIIEAGSLRIILSIEEQEFLKLASRSSGMANMFNRVNVVPTDEASTMKVLEDQVPVLERRLGVSYTYAAMKEAYRLGDRYITDRAEPGRALRLLEISAGYAEPLMKMKMVTGDAVRTAVEKSLGVKVKVVENGDDRERLLNMEELIHKRMVNQVGAVKTVSSALQRAAAGVRNQNRPIGTFLFLGPTGVGKTELAKAVSEVYFHGESQIVRLDLNEFVNAGDVARLIADGAEDEMSLTAQVMKRPFSVVLLDEIEKAHPQVLTALLQVLDEGMLRDIKNREVSFRDAIIIATSNAGADLIRKYVAEGMSLAEAKDKLTNHLIDKGEFRPEFLNRFDEICVFTPLSKDDLMKVADLMLMSTNKTLETQKIKVKLSEEAKRLLVEKGYDPQLGARPMRRIIQKTVENIAAKAILRGEVETGGEVEITEEMVQGEL